MKIIIRKKHRVRHKILKTLQNHYLSTWGPYLEEQDIALSLSKLVDLSKLSENDVYEQLSYLKVEKEINYLEINHSSFYIISEAGKVALYDKKHLYNGRKMLYDEVYDIVKNISAICLLIIAVTTFISNMVETKNNSKEIKILKNEIEALSELVLKKKIINHIPLFF